jgi:hypothetical protein
VHPVDAVDIASSGSDDIAAVAACHHLDWMKIVPPPLLDSLSTDSGHPRWNCGLASPREASE